MCELARFVRAPKKLVPAVSTKDRMATSHSPSAKPSVAPIKARRGANLGFSGSMQYSAPSFSPSWSLEILTYPSYRKAKIDAHVDYDIHLQKRFEYSVSSDNEATKNRTNGSAKVNTCQGPVAERRIMAERPCFQICAKTESQLWEVSTCQSFSWKKYTCLVKAEFHRKRARQCHCNISIANKPLWDDRSDSNMGLGIIEKPDQSWGKAKQDDDYRMVPSESVSAEVETEERGCN